MDAGWAWVVCAASFFIQFIVFGTIQSFGIIFVSLLNEFQASEYETVVVVPRFPLACVGSMAYGMLFFIGPVTTALTDHVGCRKMVMIGTCLIILGLVTSSFATSLSVLYVTFGVLWSIGASFAYFPAILVLRFYFFGNLSFANGLSMTGAGIGTIVLNSVINYVNQRYGWRTGMRMLGGVSAVMFVCGSIYLPPPQEFLNMMDWTSYEKISRFIDPRPWKMKPFIVFSACMCCICFGYFVPYVHLVRYAETLSVPLSEGALLLGYISISAIFGKLLCGRVAD
ncbi:predicted protein, partial [Nematostella vectensis]